MCAGCSLGKCQYHKSRIVAKDSITGIEFMIKCVCSKRHTPNLEVKKIT